MNLSDRLSNVNGWIYLLLIGIVIYLAYFITKHLYYYFKERTGDVGVKHLKKAKIGIVIFIAAVFFFFLNFGAGEAQEKINVKDSGEYKEMQNTGPEMTEDELKQDAIDKQTKELTIQSNDSLREIYLKESEKKSDAIVEKYLND